MLVLSPRLFLAHLLLASLQRTAAHPAVAHYPSTRSIAGRQEFPVSAAPTSSFDYWWPYPPNGATSTTPAMSAPVNPSTNAFATPAPVVTSASLPATNLAAASNISSTSSLSSSSLSPASSTTSASMTTITALPPGTNPQRHSKQSRPSPLSAGYLAGIFVVVGAIVGFAFSWILLTIMRKCRAPREKGFKAGAMYTAPPEHSSSEGTSSGGGDIHESVSHFLGIRPLEEADGLPGGGGADVRREGSWLQRAFTSRKREAARLRAESAALAVADVDESFVGGGREDDPFLVPPSSSRHVSSRSSRVEYAIPPVESRVQTPADELEENSELDNAPFDTLRHKSIRRDILDRLKHGSRYRKGHQRVDSDVTLEGIQSRSEGGESVLTEAFRSPVPVPVSLPLTATTTTASSGPGFRIIEEDTEAQSSGSSRPGWSFPLLSSAADAGDTYTAIPPRMHSPERRGHSPLVTTMIRSPPGSPRRNVSKAARPRMTRVDSSVLPSSPPLVTSPPLEAQLFFETSPSFKSGPRLSFSSAAPEPARPKGAQAREKPKGRTLHTKRSPQLLPFPSSPQFHRTKRQDTTPSPSPHKRSASRRVDGHVNPGALTKVDQILAQGWSARKLQGEEYPASPTKTSAAVRKQRH
ncbi:hypothetical protein BDW22DRAFT_670584 [Trametopsis cervina]|nr:hypothetical protein BDW22DRAFT_670584 [Trametopsis cervina]